MASTAKRSTAKPGSGPELSENHTDSEAIAHAIVAKSAYLAPSVNKIMASDLTEVGRLRAVTLFRESLDSPGDPNRHPVQAIENGRLAEGDAALAS